MGPLAGLKIIELAGIGPGPMTAMMLGDMGADVVRIDRARSGPMERLVEPRYSVHGRSRRSVAVDLQKPEAADASETRKSASSCVTVPIAPPQSPTTNQTACINSLSPCFAAQDGHNRRVRLLNGRGTARKNSSRPDSTPQRSHFIVRDHAARACRCESKPGIASGDIQLPKYSTPARAHLGGLLPKSPQVGRVAPRAPRRREHLAKARGFQRTHGARGATRPTSRERTPFGQQARKMRPGLTGASWHCPNTRPARSLSSLRGRSGPG